MPGSFSDTSTEAMFGLGKILRVGGGPYSVAGNAAVIITSTAASRA